MGDSIMTHFPTFTSGTLDRYISDLVGRCGSGAICSQPQKKAHFFTYRKSVQHSSREHTAWFPLPTVNRVG